MHINQFTVNERLIGMYFKYPWGSLGFLGVPWGSLGFPGVPWGSLGLKDMPHITNDQYIMICGVLVENVQVCVNYTDVLLIICFYGICMS